MNQVMPAKIFDLKNSSSKMSYLARKEKDDGFQKELDKKEKESTSKDSLSGSQEQRLEDRSSWKKTSQDNKSSSRDQRELTGSRAVSSNPNTKVQTEKGETSNQPKEGVQDISSVNADVAAEVQALEAQELLAAFQMEQGPMMSEGISLEGMELVKPEVMASLEIPMEANSATDSSQIESLISEALASTSPTFSESQFSEGDGEGSPFSTDILNESLNPQATPLDKTQNVGFDSILKAAASTEAVAAKEANVDHIVHSARTLIKDGGGEMQIKLNPEGLGAVNLKVGVQAGEVNIEIIAQDQMVKKMFEEGMGDIRSALELQNLKVETFKVDVSHHAEQNLNDQNQDNMNREFARDFMNQFRGERQAMRNQGMSYDMERSPDFSKSPEGLKPATSSVSSNGRLNVVA